MRYNSRDITPSQDTGWGLIFRLNDILRDIEYLVMQGKYDDWNFKLDRIWTNLCYRDDVDIIYDSQHKIKEINLKDSDFKEKSFIDLKIMEAKQEMKAARKKYSENYITKQEYIKWKNELYQRLLFKDIWTRKLMRKLGLYMKEIKHNPAGAMFGR